MQRFYQLFYFFFFLMSHRDNSLIVRRIKLGDRIPIHDNEEIKKPLEDSGKEKDGIDTRFQNISDDSDSFHQIFGIYENMRKMKALKTLEYNDCSLQYKLNILEENNDLFHFMISDPEEFNVTAGGLKEDLDDFFN